MTKLYNSIFIIFLISCSSNAQKFKIDNSISKEIDSTFKANILFDSPIKPEFSFHVSKTFDYEKFGENGMDLAYFLKSSDNTANEYVNSITECYLSKDTIVLVGGLGYVSGIGFRIVIFDDRFNCETGLESDEKIYAKKDNKDLLVKEVVLKADSQSMSLTQRPKLQIGNIIKGKIKLKSQPFYQLDKNQKAILIYSEFDIIFDTKIKVKEKD